MLNRIIHYLLVIPGVGAAKEVLVLHVDEVLGGPDPLGHAAQDAVLNKPAALARKQRVKG